MTGRRRGAGFTLIELVLSLALTGVVVVLTVPFANTQKRLWERSEERREASRALAGALYWLTRDLEQAGYHGGSPALQAIAPASLTYVVSRDESDPAGFSAANRRSISFWLDGSDVKYRIRAPLDPPAVGWESGSTQILASGIAAMFCRAIDRDGAETAVASRAALVECTLSGSAGLSERVVARLRTGPQEPGP